MLQASSITTKKMATFAEVIASIPLPVQLAFAVVGLLFLASKVASYLRVLLGLFVLGGTNVGNPRLPGLAFF